VKAHTVGQVFMPLVAFTGWKSIGAMSLLFGLTALSVHALFEFVERWGRRPQDGHHLVVTLSHTRT
jgi:hypothetical protein